MLPDIKAKARRKMKHYGMIGSEETEAQRDARQARNKRKADAKLLAIAVDNSHKAIVAKPLDRRAKRALKLLERYGITTQG